MSLRLWVQILVQYTGWTFFTFISSASFVRETYLANNFVRLRTLSTWLISIKNTFRVFASINGQIFSGKNINFVAANQNRFQQLASLVSVFCPLGVQ